MDFSIRRVSMVLALAIVAFVACVGPAAGEQLTTASRVSFRGIGPVRIGMTVEEVERVIGSKLVGFSAGLDDVCQELAPEDGAAIVGFIAIDGIIRRVDIAEPGILTISGVGVGDTEATIKRIYGEKLRIEQHFYDPEGHYLIVDSPDGQNELLFETDGKKVITYRAGRRQEVGYVEGCA